MKSVGWSIDRRVPILDEVGNGEANNGEETGDGVHASTGSDGLGSVSAGRRVVLRLRAAVTTAASVAALTTAVAVSVAVTAAVSVTVVGAVVVAALTTLRSVSTMRSLVAGVARSSTVGVDMSTASGNRVVCVRRRVDGSSVVAVVIGDGVNDGLGHTLAWVGRMRIGVGLSLGDNVAARVVGHGLMGLGRLGRVGIGRLVRLRRLMVSRLSVNLSDRADGSGDGNGLGGDMTNRAVDDSRRALCDGVCLGGVDSAGGVLSRGRMSRLGHVAGLSVDSGEANVRACLGGGSAIDDGLVVVSVGNSSRSGDDDS